MILRRLTKHVKDQNWFAVTLDFFIVVLGILIAFQINTWSDRQAVKKSVNVSLSMLLSDLTSDIERLDVVTNAQTTRIAAFGRVSAGLMAPALNYSEIASDINIGIDNSRTLLVRDTIYDTMEKEGQLTVLPLELRRMISATYGYDFPTLATAGLQMDHNQDEVGSRCINTYWDWDLGVPISETREDLARLRSCFANLRDYSVWYLERSQGEVRQNADALKLALQEEVNIISRAKAER